MAYAGKVGETTPPARRRGISNDRIGPVATGVAMGLLVGAGLALLLAPMAGPDARRALKRRWRHAGVRTSDAWDDLRFELKRARRKLARARRLQLDRAEALSEV